MLMYGYQPRSPITVGLATEKIQQVKDFLQNHFDMLKVTRHNVRQAQERYKYYKDMHFCSINFEKRDQVFLCVAKVQQV